MSQVSKEQIKEENTLADSPEKAKKIRNQVYQ